MKAGSQIARVLALLVEANGEFVPTARIAELLGLTSYDAGIRVSTLRNVRPDLTIENKRGIGYRLVVPGAGEQLPPVEQGNVVANAGPAPAVNDLSPAHKNLLAMLVEADGGFVRGRALSAGSGIPVPYLTNSFRKLGTARPDLVIEGKRGSGYRIAFPGVALREGEPTIKRGFVAPLHHRMAANKAILDLLPAKTAEMVKTIAAEAGEDVDAMLHRLISYGVEVHNGLRAAGENPVGLRAVTRQQVAA